MALPNSLTTGALTSAAAIRADGIDATTIIWGTDGLLNTPQRGGSGYSKFYAVLRFHERPLVDNIRLPQGAGLTSARVQVYDGVQWDFTVRDDTTMTPPNPGTLVSIVDAQGMLGTRGNTYNARVTESAWESAPKQPGERTITVEKLLLVD